jgi:predicted MFS family arabinose efflux permease
MKKANNIFLPYLMWLIPLVFFGYQFILRLWPGLMMDPIMRQFAIDSTSFGLLASVYYWGYAGMQIPIAIALDKYGPKYILFLCAVVCGFATWLFSNTDSWSLALLSRFLVGAGSAAGFLTISKIISQWFPKVQYSKMVGYSFGFGLMGAVYGGRPINNMVEISGHHKVALLLSAVAIIIGIFSILFLTNNGPHQQSIARENQIKFADLKNVISSPAICLLAIANLLMVGSLEGFADVWGINYLINAYNLDKGDAAAATSFIFIGMIFGGPILAIIGNKIGNYSTIALCGVGMTITFCLLTYANINYDHYVFASMFFIMGVLCCYQVLIFTVGNELVSQKLLGITVAFLNCINMFGGTYFHSIIGHLMDRFWKGQMDNGIKIYSLESYNYSLAVIPMSAIVGTLIVLFIRAKYTKE